MSDSEVVLFLEAEMQYSVTELVDPELDVVAKVPKCAGHADTGGRLSSFCDAIDAIELRAVGRDVIGPESGAYVELRRR